MCGQSLDFTCIRQGEKIKISLSLQLGHDMLWDTALALHSWLSDTSDTSFGSLFEFM